MPKQVSRRLKITKVISDDYFINGAGAVPELITDLAARQAQAIAEGYDGLFVREEFDGEDCYLSLVAERDETDEEMNQRLAKAKAEQERMRVAKQKQAAQEKEQQKKTFVALAKKLAAAELSGKEIDAIEDVDTVLVNALVQAARRINKA